MRKLSFLFVNLLAATAAANGNPLPPPTHNCPPIDINSCQDGLFYDCAGYRSQCPGVLDAAFTADNQASTSSRQALAPPGTNHAGQVVPTKYTPFDPVASSLQLIGATDGYHGVALNHRAWVQNPTMNGSLTWGFSGGRRHPRYVDPEAVFAKNGARVNSCEEYAYKRFASMSGYEDFVAGVSPLDYWGIYRGLYMTALIYNNEIDDQQGNFVTPWYLPPHAKNIYFELPVQNLPLRKYTYLFANVAALSAVGNGASPEIPTDPNQQYGFLQNLVNQFGADVLEQRYADMKRFRELETKRQQLADSYPSLLWVQCIEDPTGCQQQRADIVQAIYAIDAELDQMLSNARAIGCLAPTGVTACDLSPHQIVDEVHAAVDAFREPDYQACVKITGNKFGTGSIVDRATQGGLASSGIPAHDYAATAGDLKTLIDAVGQSVSSVQLPVDPATGLYTLGNEKSDYQSWGSEWFGADYSYDAAWHITDLAAPNQICNANLHLKSSITVDGTILDDKIGVVDFLAALDTSGTPTDANNDAHVQSHFKLLGSDVYTPVDTTQTLNFSIALGGIDSGDKRIWSSPPLIIPIGPIDILVSGGISGGVGVAGSMNGGMRRNCGANSIGVSANSNIEPHAHLEGFAQAALGVPALLEVGVRGSVTLVRAGLPFNAGLSIALSGNGALTLSGTSSLSLDLSSFGGNIAVFLDSFLYSTEKELISWKGVELTQKLFELDFTTPIAVDLIRLKLGQPAGS